MAETLRTEIHAGVCSIVFTRGSEYNTINAQFRDELSAAIDEAERDDTVRVILLRAEGKAFCAGYGLDWTTDDQAEEEQWDSVQDMREFIGPYVATFLKLWYASKPTIAAVNGWCVGGGTDMVLCCDLIVAGDNAVFGYPPSRVYGTPTTAMWVYRMGMQQAKRYLLTGDEIAAPEAARIGLILESVPDESLQDHALALARRIANVPSSQLFMLKMLCNQAVEQMGFRSSVTLGTLLDGIARHTVAGQEFVQRTRELGWRQAVRERDDPFQDYGSRPGPR
jgi:enoyl-CoA hydratase